MLELAKEIEIIYLHSRPDHLIFMASNNSMINSNNEEEKNVKIAAKNDKIKAVYLLSFFFVCLGFGI